ncbi:hypothetical protein [Mesoplasma photuris]|uniref:hypothetical protein n=1 Tax=Mesoplasma photuris TaxID=217731 RepID=UPI0004E1E423|nr:hypothetical protein [Mesoplasma photuris]
MAKIKVKKGLVLKEYLNSSWITNFWVTGNDIYFTNSDFDHDQNFLAKIDAKILKENLVIKSFQNNFLNNPDPNYSNLLEISESELELLEYHRGFIFSLIDFENDKLTSIIDSDKSYVKNSNGKIIEKLNNYVILGVKQNELVLKSFSDKKIYLFENNIIKNFKENITNIINFDDYTIYLTNDNKIYKNDKEIFKSNDDLTITKFDEFSILISSKELKETFIFSIKDENKVHVLINNYFYRMINYNKEIFIGKPLFDQFGNTNYFLPISFIF